LSISPTALVLLIADILAGRKNYGKIEGELLYDQQHPNSKFFRSIVGYVEQFVMSHTFSVGNKTRASVGLKHFTLVINAFVVLTPIKM